MADLRLISRDEARAIEFEVECEEALLSPSTGIVDSHALMLALQGDAEAHGAVVARVTSVEGYRYDEAAKSFAVLATSTGADSDGDDDVQEVECDYFVNATGLFAPRLVAEDMTASPMGQPAVPAKFAKGTYFKLSSRHPFRLAFTLWCICALNRPRILLLMCCAVIWCTRSQRSAALAFIRPWTSRATCASVLTSSGSTVSTTWYVCRPSAFISECISPDSVACPILLPQPDASKAEAFAERIQSYWPAVRADMLVADYCGIRPKIDVDNKTFGDFWIAVSSVT